MVIFALQPVGTIHQPQASHLRLIVLQASPWSAMSLTTVYQRSVLTAATPAMNVMRLIDALHTMTNEEVMRSRRDLSLSLTRAYL